MNNYNNGHIIDASKIPSSDYEKAAKEWSEGSKALEELLLYCLKNNIITQACCIGHDDIKEANTAYLQFELSERNKKHIIKLIQRYYNLDGIDMSFVNQPGLISRFNVEVPKSIGEQFFKDMLIQLSNGIDVEIDNLTPDMKSTVFAMIGHKVPNDYLEVHYSVKNNKRELFVAASNPNYFDLFLGKNEPTKPWLEDSIGISGTPESIGPIIRDISEKTSTEYLNYIKNQRGDSNQDNINTSSTSMQPETSDKKRFIPIIVNPQATHESSYARDNSMTIMEVLPGANLMDIAEVMCGQRYICEFNNFVIDGTKYETPEQIVEAYKNRWVDSKQSFLVAKKQQELIDASIREKQIQSIDDLNNGEQINGGGPNK